MMKSKDVIRAATLVQAHQDLHRAAAGFPDLNANCSDDYVWELNGVTLVLRESEVSRGVNASLAALIIAEDRIIQELKDLGVDIEGLPLLTLRK